MNDVQIELQKIGAALLVEELDSPRYRELYAAQQALAWSQEAAGFRSPFNMIMCIQANSEGCSGLLHPPLSSDISYPTH